MIVSDNGTELTSNAVLAWCGEIGVEWHYIVFAGQKTRRGIELQRRQFHGSSVGLVSINALVVIEIGANLLDGWQPGNKC